MEKVQQSTAEAMLVFYTHLQEKYDEELRPYTKKCLKRKLNDIIQLLRSMDNESEKIGVVLHEWIEHEVSQLKVVRDKNENLDQPFRLFVIGTGKVGKSKFINSLIGREVAEVDYFPKTWRIDIFTRDEGQPIKLGFSDGHSEDMIEDKARLLLAKIDKRAEENIDKITRELKEIKRDKELTKEAQKERKEAIIKSYESDDDITHVIWPVQSADFLNDFDLVDTPGMNQILYNHKIKREALAYYREADGILWLLPADNLSDKSTYEDVQSMYEIYPQKTTDAIAVLNHFDYVPEKDADEVCSEANRIYGKYFREIIPYSAKIAFDVIKKNEDAEQTEKLKHEIHQSFYRKAQENKINDLDGILQEEQKKMIFFLRRKARLIGEKYDSYNQVEIDWKNRLEHENNQFSDNIHAYLSEEIEEVYKRARDNESILGNMENDERNQYIKENILKYKEIRDKIRLMQSNFSLYLNNSMKEFFRNFVYIVKNRCDMKSNQVDFSDTCQFNEKKIIHAFMKLVTPIDLDTSFSGKVSEAFNSIFLGKFSFSNVEKVFHPSEHIRDVYEVRFKDLENDLNKESHKLIQKVQYRAIMHTDTYFNEMYCNKYKINDILKIFDKSQLQIKELCLESPTALQLIKGRV